MFLFIMKHAGPAASERNAALKKLWKYRYFRTAAAAVCLTLLGLSFSLAGRKTTGPSTLSADPEARGAAPAALTGGSDAKTDLPSAPTGEPAEENASRESTESVTDGTLSGSRFTEESPAPALLHVYVCGSVNRPEVYVLPEGSRITDAVRAAGGFTEDAARDSRNLAELLTDGEMILIPSEEEWAAAGKNGGNVSRNAAEDPPAVKTPRESGKKADGRIDLNTADAETLMTLPGIGESKASRIIAWREQYGPFRSAEDLMRIPGIKQSTYNQLKDQITAE